jgi:hypothetical protein
MNSTKYKIEGDLNFFTELKKSLNNDVGNNIDNTDNISSNDMCLITNSPLVNYSVTMSCGHKFNYIPLYNEIIIQKCKKNMSETCILGTNQIKCPYCRKIQNKLLDYYEELDNDTDNCKRVFGVNTIEITYRLLHKCSYVTYINTNNCQVYCSSEHNIGLFEDGKHYCDYHLSDKIRYKKLQMIKQTKLENKLKLKEEAKKLKQEAKQLEKEIKKKQKEEIKVANKNKSNTSLENEVISILNSIPLSNETNESNDTSTLLCSQKLKYGPNKGKQCGQGLYMNNMCKRHYNLLNNIK